MPHPPPEAYTRSTEVERFRALHPAAHAIVDRLVARYRVERRDRTVADPHRPGDEAPVVDLVPADPRAGTLSITFTALPGLIVAMGRWRRLALPGCGCDACDEDPDELADELRDAIGPYVAGTTGEHLARWWRPGVTWRSPDGEQWQRLSRADARRAGPGGTVRWAAWPRRTG